MRVGILIALLVLAARPVAAEDDSWGLAVDSRGRAYLPVDRREKTFLYRVDPDGKATLLHQARFIRDVRLDRAEHPVILRFEQRFHQGELTTLGDNARRGIVIPSPYPVERSSITYWGQFVIDRQGTILYASDYRVMRFSKEREPIFLAGGKHGTNDGKGPLAQFYGIRGLALAPNGDLVVADVDKVRRIRPDSSVTTVAIGLHHQELDDPVPNHPPRAVGIAVGPDDAIYVAVDPLGRITRIQPDGTKSVVARFPERWQPRGVALHGGKIYASEYMWDVIKYVGPRLRVFERDGRSRVVADLSERPDTGDIPAR